MFFLMLRYGVSTTLLQILISLRFPIHPSKGVHWCSRKRLSELSKVSVHWCFEKIATPKILHTPNILHTFQRNIQGEFFLGILAGQQLFGREPVSACFCKKELHSTR